MNYYEARRSYWNTWAPHAQPRGRRFLTESQHREIIRLVKDGHETMAAVARKLGLAYSTVTKIVYGTRKARKVRELSASV
jgi:hypothetical protein